MKKLEVCFTPDLLSYYPPEGKVVVVIDIFRATTTMVTALANGIESITPVASLEACKSLQNQGYLAAAEREGKMPEGFDLGNSPLSHIEQDFSGQKLAMTTSNGTLAITKSKTADQIIIGAFINMTAVVKHLQSQSNDILLLCAGWKGRVNMEDSLFAGAIAHTLASEVTIANDAAVMASHVYQAHQEDMDSFLQDGLHYHRLQRLGRSQDIEFCLKKDVYDLLPIYQQGILIAKT